MKQNYNRVQMPSVTVFSIFFNTQIYFLTSLSFQKHFVIFKLIISMIFLNTQLHFFL